jgi:hypothetical protein
MKRIYLLAALLALIFGSQMLVTCSNPLEVDDDPDPTPPVHDTLYLTDTLTLVDTLELLDTVIVTDTLLETDTLTLVDTLTEVDTLTIVDTLTEIDTVSIVDTLTLVDTLVEVDTLTVYDTTIVVDTLTFTDTVTIVDTVEIYIPGSTCIHTICGTLSADNHEIFWNFRGMGGTYVLTFEATAVNTKPPKQLIVLIDGNEYTWDTDQSMVFTMPATLDDNSEVVIYPDDPTALGHYIRICLTFSDP